jgi:hypothetical protein
VIKSIRISWEGLVTLTGEVLVVKPEEKGPLGRPRHRWENNIKMDLQDVGWGGLGSGLMWLKKGQVVGACECGSEPLVSIKCGQFLD